MDRQVLVLILGADQRQGLSVIRSLGRHGVPVVVAGPSDTSIGFYSRYASARLVYPSPEEKPEEFIECLIAAIKRFQVKLVMPLVESTLAVVHHYRKKIEPYALLAIPPGDSMDLCLSKDRQIRLAAKLGIPIPTTITPKSLKEAKESLDAFTLPVVLKPSNKPTRPSEKFSGGVLFIDSWSVLQSRLSEYFTHGVLPVIQEFHVGNGIGCGVLMNHAQPLCCYQYLRGRENLPTGGVPVRYESMSLWPKVRDYSVRILSAMNWHGIAQVEWKEVPGADDVVFMEVNGRFWASLPGAVHAGMDFPFWLYELLTDRPGTFTQNYRAGIVTRNLRGDLGRLTTVLRSYPNISSVPLKSRWRETLDFFLDFFRWGLRADVHWWSDPVPGFHEACGIVLDSVRRVQRRVGARGNLPKI